MKTTETTTETRAARLARLGITGPAVHRPLADLPGAQTVAELRREKVTAAAEEFEGVAA